MVNLFKCQISIYIICKDPPNMLWLTCVLPLHSFTATYWMYKFSCTCFYLPKNFLAWCYFTLRGLYQIILLQHPIISSTKKTLALLHFWMPKLTSQRKKSSIWMFPKIGVPQNGWFVMENLIKMDDLGAPLLSPIVGNTMKHPYSSWKLSLWPTSTGHFNDAADSFRDDKLSATGSTTGDDEKLRLQLAALCERHDLQHFLSKDLTEKSLKSMTHPKKNKQM